MSESISLQVIPFRLMKYFPDSFTNRGTEIGGSESATGQLLKNEDYDFQVETIFQGLAKVFHSKVPKK